MQGMKIKIKHLAIAFSVAFTGLFALGPALLAANNCDANSDGTVTTQEAIQCGANGANGSSQTSQQAEGNVNTTIKNIINLLTVIIGIVAVVMVLIAGFRYITSGGKQESVASAKNTLLYAVIGLIIVALAQIIVRFVLHNATT